MTDDLISRQDAYDVLTDYYHHRTEIQHKGLKEALSRVPSAQPSIYGYNVEHLELIARILQKENVPPEGVVQALTDIGRIVAIISDEFQETLRKAVDQCMT